MIQPKYIRAYRIQIGDMVYYRGKVITGKVASIEYETRQENELPNVIFWDENKKVIDYVRVNDGIRNAKRFA